MSFTNPSTIPGVFDLHERGLFKTRPYVTKEYAYRVIASDDLSTQLQFLCLKEEAVNDPTTGERYSFFKELIKRINLFQRVYDCDKQDPMRKPNGRTWKSEDEIWECWIGFAGTEEEAIRVCRTMEAVFRPLVEEMAQQKAETRT